MSAMKLSVVIPARNEVDGIAATLRSVANALEREQVDYEILVVDDSSTDGTAAAVADIAAENERIYSLRSHYSQGFGLAVREGLERFSGDAVAIMMADGSDDPE